MNIQDTIPAFKAEADKLWAVRSGAVVLQWENLTGAPKGGLRSRGKALAVSAQLSAEMITSDKMKGFLDTLEAAEKGGEPIGEDVSALVRILRREYNGYKNIPSEFLREYEEHVTTAQSVWEEAKRANDFSMFAPYLKKNIELAEKLIKLKKPEMAGKSVYNALLDEFEDDLTTADLDPFFASLRDTVSPLVKRVGASSVKIDKAISARPVSKEAQEAVAYKLMELIGYDVNRSMLAEAEHPFSTGISKFDTRVTTHYYDDNFLSSLFSTLHECGHAIYEQGKRDDIAETLLDNGVSAAIHESQSRFYENIIGRSMAFWDYAWPIIQPILGANYADVTAEQIYLAANEAKPSLIRIEADELTYVLHVNIRYELEREIFEAGAANVDINSLPKKWNEKYEKYLGVTPPTDAQGVLQDTHWADASFGYFPSYAMGSAYGAQLLSYMRKDFDVFEAVRGGEIRKVTEWLNRHIHQYGSLYKPKDLFRKIGGEDLNPKYFTDYLTEKFEGIYQL